MKCQTPHKLTNGKQLMKAKTSSRLDSIANHISAHDFEEIKKKTGYRCLTCWAVEGKPHWRDSESIVKLQQGLRDPEQAPTKDNIMPWCQHCSRHYHDYFVFDEKGRIRTVASIEPVARASLRVQREALRFLRAESA